MSVHVSAVQVSAGKGRSGQVSVGQCRSVQASAGKGRSGMSVQVSAGQCIKHIAPSRLPGFRHANTSVSVVPAPGSPGLNYSFMWIVNPMHWRYGYQFVEFVSYRIYKF